MPFETLQAGTAPQSQDLGIVLDASAVLRCDTRNRYFAGGNGDFSALLDAKATFRSTAT